MSGYLRGVRRRSTSLVAALLALLAVLAVLVLNGPATPAASGPVHEQRSATASADRAVANEATGSRESAELPTPGHQTDALPPVRHHHVKPAVMRHRGGGRSLPTVHGRTSTFLQPRPPVALLPRAARATAAPPGRPVTTYPMRT